MNYRWVKAVLCIMTFSLLSACSVYETPEVHFFFKTTDGKGAYSEDIEAFEVGKVFYTNIGIRLVTNKKKPRNYRVVVEIPKTDEVKMAGRGGFQPDSITWDETQKLTRLTFHIQGYRETQGQRLEFYGTPKEEGKAAMKVNIYREDDTPIRDGKYYKELHFKYNLQE
ncbi:hypothetical protein [Candidatus Avelusimicrobium fimicolum]|uniref:hypothetical protein n=1 Tax=Candidatus Avelusimicrobium fimicolum TaxID=3416216 RepID=UPI003D0DB1EC